MRWTPLVLCLVSPLAALPGVAGAAEVTIARDEPAQTIEGFGFFGAHDVWWGRARDMVDDAWIDAVIDDLGLTIWRNEIHPPADSLAPQDADWAKQKPVVQALAAKAKAAGVPLKVILSVWSPPSGMKCVANDEGVVDGSPHPGGAKNGGGLCPSKRADFARYLIDALKLYAEVGVDVYALSFQNEPLFVEPYNSCVYTQREYVDTLAAIGPILHAAYPALKLFGAENMLAIECGGANGFDPYWYTANLMKSAAALAQLGALAVHGYTDGVLATPTSKMSKYWASFHAGTAATGLPTWMTETSGYLDTMEGNGTLPGALDLAQAIFAALVHGHASAWVWWQGSELGDGAPSEYALMSGVAKRGKKYHVSKQFYRFIRPGARRVSASGDDPEVLVTAFDHPAANTFTVVAINAGKASKTVTLAGARLPASFTAYRTSAAEDSVALGAVSPSGLALPARSITTLVADQGGVVPPSTGGTTAPNPTATGGAAGSPGGSPPEAPRPKASGCGCVAGGVVRAPYGGILVVLGWVAGRRRRHRR